MSTLRVNSLTNGSSPIDFPSQFVVGAGKLVREYYEQATTPAGATAGAVWKDTSNNDLKILLGTSWYIFTQLGTYVPSWYGGRGVFIAGNTGTSSNVMDYVSIASGASATDFGDQTFAKQFAASCSNGTRGLTGGGSNSSFVGQNVIEYHTFATPGNAIDFGDLTFATEGLGACSNGVYGLFGGGGSNVAINYVTIATAANAASFGNFSTTKKGAVANSTRGVFLNTTMEYVTIATPGNATTFGTITSLTNGGAGGASDATRGLFSNNDGTESIDYITIMTTGNATDFGTLVAARQQVSACANGTRALFGGGAGASWTNLSGTEYVTIQTLGNAVSGGSLTVARQGIAACSGD